MKACEPVKPTPSQPSAPTLKEDNVHSVSLFKNFFCYIVHTFFPFRTVKNTTNPNMETTPSGSTTSGGSVESATKKTTKCRVPVFIRRMKGKCISAEKVDAKPSFVSTGKVDSNASVKQKKIDAKPVGKALASAESNVSSKHKKTDAIPLIVKPVEKLGKKVVSADSKHKKTDTIPLIVKPVEKMGKKVVAADSKHKKTDAIPPIVSLVNPTRKASVTTNSNISSKDSSVLSVSKSLSCHLLVTPKTSKIQRKVRKRTSENSVQVTPPKKVVLDTKPIKPPLQLSRAVQVGSRDVVLNAYTTQLEVVPPSRGDAVVVDKPSPITSRSSLIRRPLPRKRTFSNLNPPLLRNKSVVAASKKPPEPLKNEASKTLTLPSSLTPPPPPKLTNSSQTIESWPVLQKRLGLFERTKRKLSRERKKPLTSTYVQAVEAPVKRANVKCLVYVEQGSKGTLARIAPSGLERIESCVNTETSDNSSGIQCDIALRRSRTPKRAAASGRKLNLRRTSVAAVQKESSEDVRPQTDEGKLLTQISTKNMADKSENMDVVGTGRHKKAAKPARNLQKWDEEVVKDVAELEKSGGGRKDLVTVLSKRRMDPRVSNSESVCPDHHISDLKVITTDDDPLHCLNEFISLEHMLHRLQDEIHGLDSSIRQISTNYQFPSVLTSVAPTESSFDRKMKSVAGLVRSYQNELDITANEQFASAYRRHNFNEYR